MEPLFRNILSHLLLLFACIETQHLRLNASVGFNFSMLRRGAIPNEVFIPVPKSLFAIFYIIYMYLAHYEDIKDSIVAFHISQRLAEEVFTRTTNFSGFMSFLHFTFGISYYTLIVPEMVCTNSNSILSIIEVVFLFSIMGQQCMLHTHLFSSKNTRIYGPIKSGLHYYLELAFYAIMSRHLKQPLATLNCIWIFCMIQCNNCSDPILKKTKYYLDLNS